MCKLWELLAMYRSGKLIVDTYFKILELKNGDEQQTTHLRYEGNLFNYLHYARSKLQDYDVISFRVENEILIVEIVEDILKW